MRTKELYHAEILANTKARADAFSETLAFVRAYDFSQFDHSFFEENFSKARSYSKIITEKLKGDNKLDNYVTQEITDYVQPEDIIQLALISPIVSAIHENQIAKSNSQDFKSISDIAVQTTNKYLVDEKFSETGNLFVAANIRFASRIKGLESIQQFNSEIIEIIAEKLAKIAVGRYEHPFLGGLAQLEGSGLLDQNNAQEISRSFYQARSEITQNRQSLKKMKGLSDETRNTAHNEIEAYAEMVHKNIIANLKSGLTAKTLES